MMPNLPSQHGDGAGCQLQVISHLQRRLLLCSITPPLLSSAGNKNPDRMDQTYQTSLNSESSWIRPRRTPIHHIRVKKCPQKGHHLQMHTYGTWRGSGERDQLCTSLRMTPREAGGSSHCKRGPTICTNTTGVSSNDVFGCK